MKDGQRWFKIGELEKKCGVSRHTIHLYLQIGLLHAPIKTGKTMAYYDDAHVQKLKYIRKLKKQGLPLNTIRDQISEMVVNNYFEIQDTADFQVKKKNNKGQKYPKRMQGKKTRESILELATILFKEKGYKATKINDITGQLNIGKGSFYFFFNNKTELFLACAPEIFNALFSEGWEKIRQEEDPIKRLELRVQIALPVVREFSAIIKLSKEVLESDDPKLRKLGGKIISSIRKPIESDIKKCIESGQIQPVEPKLVSILTIGMMESIDFMLSIEKEFSLSAVEEQLYFLLKIPSPKQDVFE